MSIKLGTPSSATTFRILAVTCAIASLVSVINAETSLTKGEACHRRCVDGDNRVCKFNFNVQTYQTLGRACHLCPLKIDHCEYPDCIVGDGVKKPLFVINKKLPGPSIDVCEGDTVIVEVHNQLPSDGITLHWHGLTHAANNYGPATPFMDGVPGMTQCNIPSGGKFTYKFAASIPGTHWWHSHSGFQRGDGMFGSLIIRKPSSKESNKHLYDYDLSEHIIMLHDRTFYSTEENFASRHYGDGSDFPENILVNGHGIYTGERGDRTYEMKNLPYSRFNILKGKRYRFRLISAAILNCPINVQFEEHQMTVINSDGHDLKPFNVTSLVIYPGERYDVVIQGQDCPSDPDYYEYDYEDYSRPQHCWISFMGLVDCAESKAYQMAVLKVHDKISYAKFKLNSGYYLSDELPFKQPYFTTEKPLGVQLGAPNSACYADKLCISDIRGINPMPDDIKKPKADQTHYLAFTMRKINNKHFYDKKYYSIESFKEDAQIPSPQVNNISHIPQFTPLLMAESEPREFCHADAMPSGLNCHNEYCECFHLIKVPMEDIVDLVLIDEGPHSDEGHPVHLHGLRFWVLGQDRPRDEDDAMLTRERVIQMDKEGLLKRNFEYPPLKDTVSVPDAGYTIVRFKADNPGYWLLHCHLVFHSMAGMSVVIQVGEHHDMPSAPSGFPTCHHFEGF